MRKAYRQLRHRRMRRNRFFAGISHRLKNRRLWKPCRDTVAHGLAIGFFFGLLWMMPGQSFVAAFFAIRARVNVPFAMLATFFSNPLTNLPIGIFQEKLGGFMREVLHVPMPKILDVSGTVPGIDYTLNLADFILGLVSSAALGAALMYPIVHAISWAMPHHLPVRKGQPEKA